MWTSIVLLATMNIMRAQTQTPLDYEPHTVYDYEMNPDPDPEQAEPQDTTELQRSASAQNHPGPSKGLGDYGPMLSCLQRKQAKLQEVLVRGSPVGHAGFKAQKNSWIQEMKSIEAELERTRCRPREVCLQVSAEHPTSTSTFYVPKCVSVHRCGGCCSSEGSDCISTSQAFIRKMLIEIIVPPSREPRPVSMLFLNHTSCGCAQPQTSRRSIIRRASVDAHPTKAGTVRPYNPSTARSHGLDPARCNKIHAICTSGLSWDTLLCHCVEDKKVQNSRGLAEGAGVCGAHRIFSEDSCSCVCKNGLDRTSCGTHRMLNKDSCSCVCKNGLDSLSCGLHRVFNEDLCSCVCKNGYDSSSCGPHMVFNKDLCSCVCKESLDSMSCGLNRVFNKDSCSCVCKNGLNHLSCGPHRLLDDSTCACVCPEHAQRVSCKPDWGWDKQRCQCVCQKSCPNNKPLNKANCQCECQEQGVSCLRRGMKFDPHACSCYRLPCPRRRPRCPSNHYYSVSVCHCLPNHLRAFEHH